MLDLFHGFGSLIEPLISVPSPPFWDSFVNLLEKSLDFLARTFNSAGLAVIVFTIIIKTILLPLTIKSTRSSRAMQDLQPKIKELQKKHGKDRQALSQETMKLYSQYGVNPMAGCLPMLLQMPIFFGLYRAILHLSNGSAGFPVSPQWEGGFLWLDSLATADPYHILPIMAGVFQFIQTRMMRPQGQGPISDPQQKMMNQVMMFMPITVVLFGWGFASGPVLYWVTQSVYSVVQQWLITGWGGMRDWFPFLPDLPEHRRLGYRPARDPEEVLAEIEANGGPQRGKVMGWFQAKMEEAQAQQAAKAGTAAVADTDVGERSASSSAPVPTKKSSKSKKSSGSSAPVVEASIEEPAEEPVTASSNGYTPPVPRKKRSSGAAPPSNS